MSIVFFDSLSNQAMDLEKGLVQKFNPNHDSKDGKFSSSGGVGKEAMPRTAHDGLPGDNLTSGNIPSTQAQGTSALKPNKVKTKNGFFSKLFKPKSPEEKELADLKNKISL
jgi:hypothetical protein